MNKNGVTRLQGDFISRKVQERNGRSMEEKLICTPIAHIRSAFPEKFGIPRQSGLADVPAEIVFEPDYRTAQAFEGLDEYSHIWLLWEFSEVSKRQEEWRPMVRPPRLGGNTRVGVFATRSPFRPNPIGLSCVRLDGIQWGEEGPVLQVVGADLLDGTPILDIKPYLPYVDSHPEAEGSFAERRKEERLTVEFPQKWREKVSEEQYRILCQLLEQNPRPSYQKDPDRIYGMRYADLEVKFTVDDDGVHVCGVCSGVGLCEK